MKKKILFALMAIAGLLISIGASAQSSSKITLTLKDKTTGDPVGFATVSLIENGKKNTYKYALTDAEGKANIEKVKHGTFTIKAELLGYKTYEQEIKVEKDLALGDILMDIDAEALDAASVSDVGNPIVIKKDTIEYNASSFKTTENDVLEDLLKKLPGVEIDDNGSISVNGKTIDKITVEGKTFFMNDPTIASKNLPAKAIKKIKVIRKKSEQAEFTGIDDGTEENVLDVSVQNGAMNGLFGNLTAGLGHDVPQEGYYDDETTWKNDGWRFTDNLFAGRFSTDGTQIAVIGNANNGNNMGFGNFSGNAMAGMRGGGATSGGINTSWMLGVNGAANFFDDKMEASGNYAYNGSQRDVISDSYQEQYLASGDTTATNSSSSSNTNSYGHRIGARIEHEFSENTSILFEPSINFGTGNSLSTGLSDRSTYASNGIRTALNDGFTFSNGDNKNVQSSGRLLFRQRLGLPGRTLTLNANFSYNNSTMDGLNQSLTNYATTGTQSIVNQRIDQNTNSASASGTLTYTEPMGNNIYVEANYSFSWNRSSSTQDTYNSGSQPGVFTLADHQYIKAGEELDLTYSNHIINRYINQTIGANVLVQSNKMRAQMGLSLLPTNTLNKTTRKGVETEYNNKVLNFSPRVMLQYNASDYSNVRLNYRGNSSQPSTNQLIPVPDNSNPTNISFGNPHLTPYFSHSFNGEYRHTDMKSFMSMNVSFGGGLTQNPITNATWNDLNGVRYSYPVNGANSSNANMRLTLNAPIARSNFSISTSLNGNYSQSTSYQGSSQIDMSNYYNNGEFDYELFHNDIPDLGESPLFYTNKLQNLNGSGNLRLTYRDDHVEIVTGAQTSARKSWYTVSESSTPITWNNRLNGEITWTTNNGWTVNSELNYNWYNGYTTALDDEYILNAEISKILGTFTVSLRGYDLLNQAKSLTINTSDDHYTFRRTNTLGRYVMVSVTLRFGSFGGRGNRMRGSMMRGGGRGMRGMMRM